MGAFNNGYFEEIHEAINSQIMRDKLHDKSHFYVFPCKWINPINNTNAGLKGSYEIRNRFYQLNKIIKGNESIFLNWKGSTLIEDYSEFKNSYTSIKYQKGEAWEVLKNSDSGSMEFENQTFGTFGDFTTTFDQETISVKTLRKIGKNEILDFYLIPNPTLLAEWFDSTGQEVFDQDFDDNDIYYISHYTNFYNDLGEYTYSEIEFTNIQFNMSQSGQTIEQHIYFNSPRRRLSNT